jgi:hypothetical protein
VSRKHATAFAALLFLFALGLVPAANADHWIYLGNVHVDSADDHKNIKVGSQDGQFHKIQLRVHGGAVDFQRVVVHYADGNKEELPIQDRVRDGGKSKSLELPGDRRSIDSVELWYSKEHLDTRPEVRLYATR